jgi:hypothetical protein
MGKAVQTKEQLNQLTNIPNEELYYVIEEQTFYMYIEEDNIWIEYIAE